MLGYYKQPEATAEALREGWLSAGDVGRMDEEGYFYITDRKKELIIVGGFNVFPPRGGRGADATPQGAGGCGHRRAR